MIEWRRSRGDEKAIDERQNPHSHDEVNQTNGKEKDQRGGSFNQKSDRRKKVNMSHETLAKFDNLN